MRAFNYLSQSGLDGDENPDYRPYKQFARPSLDVERPVGRPLCAGMIISEIEGEWYSVGTEYVKRHGHYRYMLHTGEVFDEYQWSKTAEVVDYAVGKFLREKLCATFNSQVWQQSLETFNQEFQRERKFKMSQLTALEQALENLIGSIENLSSPQMIKAVETRYEEARKEYDRLANEINTMDSENQAFEAVYTLRETYEPALANWDTIPHEEKRVLLHAFIDRIEATVAERYVVRLSICWRDGSSDNVVLGRQAAWGTKWTFDEAQLLLSLVDRNASQLDMAAAFPDRIWRVIGDKIKHLKDRETATVTPKPIRDFETYNEYLQRIAKRKGKPVQARHIWRKEEIQKLLELLNRGATKMEIAEAFPYRLWTHLRTKISKLKGHDFEVPGDKPMAYRESFEMYRQRVAQENSDLSSCEFKYGY